jgi:hypothetical protein
MRYRIQVTVGLGQLASVIEAACKNNPEPDLKVDSIQEHPMVALPAPRKGPIQRAGAVPIQRASPRGRGHDGKSRGDILEASLKTGPKRWSDLKTALAEGGLSESSLNSMISKWQRDGKIQRSAEGLWGLVEKHGVAAVS